MEGFLNLNKPFGFTSHDCIARSRKLLNMKRIGHGGTLDPAATGVLPIALGKATRLLQFLKTDKTYHATIRLGISTTTDDLEGEIIHSQPVAGLTLEKVQSALQTFVGKIQQVPPNYSAIQRQGKRLYELARAGEKIEVEARTVEVSKIEILDWRSQDFPEVDVTIACGGGTYIRAIARDLGTILQTGGTLAALTRTVSCGFNLQDSLTFADLETQLQTETFKPIPPLAVLQHLSAIALDETLAKRWCQGQRILWNETQSELFREIVRIDSEDGNFLGIGKIENSDAQPILIPQLVFASN